MPNSISDQRLTRQIEHLVKHLPDQDDLQGKRQGSSYTHVNQKAFVEAYKTVFKQVNGLQQKFQLTSSQKQQLDCTQKQLIYSVESAFVNNDHPPANLDSFIKKRKKA